MFNDKILIRTIAGLGVDSATAYLEFLVNQGNSLQIHENNRSQNFGLTGQLFKTAYINKKADMDALGGVNELFFAKKEDIRKYLYEGYLNTSTKPLKIVPSHYKNALDYDFVFDEFRKVDITPSNNALVKIFILFFHKFAMFDCTPYELDENANKIQIYFWDYNVKENQNDIQKKIKGVFKSNAEGKTNIAVPLLETYFAEKNLQQDDYVSFFNSYFKRFANFTDVSKLFKTETIIRAEDYIFNESNAALDALLEPYMEVIDSEKYKTVTQYNVAKVMGNFDILDNYGYDPKVEDMSNGDKLKWLMDNLIPRYEIYRKECGYLV